MYQFRPVSERMQLMRERVRNRIYHVDSERTVIATKAGTGFVKGAFCKSYRLFNKYIYKPFRAVLKIENCSKKHFNQYIYFLQC